MDPLGELRSWLTPYNYVQNNPILRVDPTGALDTLPDGRFVWEMTADERELWSSSPFDSETDTKLKEVYRRSWLQEMGGDPDEGFTLTWSERAYLLGHFFGLALPTSKLLQVGKFATSKDLINNLGDEVAVIVAKAGDDLKYLDYMGADAVYISGKGTKGTILMREDSPYSALVEEALHHAQRMKYGDEYFFANRNVLEVQAQDILISIARNEGWGASEIIRLQAARESWMKLMNNASK